MPLPHYTHFILNATHIKRKKKIFNIFKLKA
jgi:hypothetical protein